MGLPGAGSDELPPIPLYDETRREVEEEEDLFAPSRLVRGNGRRNKDRSCEPCFFLLFTGYIFSSCLRVAYALPTPLRCFPTRGLFVLICLRVPTLTSCFLILPTRLACVASVGFLLVLILHILPTRWAPVLSVEVVFFVLLGIATPGCRTLPPTPPTQKQILTNILKMPTKSLRAQAKCLRQHFTRHTLYKLNLPTKKRCSCQGVHMEERSPVSWAEQGRNRCNLADTGKARLRA